MGTNRYGSLASAWWLICDFHAAKLLEFCFFYLDPLLSELMTNLKQPKTLNCESFCACWDSNIFDLEMWDLIILISYFSILSYLLVRGITIKSNQFGLYTPMPQGALLYFKLIMNVFYASISQEILKSRTLLVKQAEATSIK